MDNVLAVTAFKGGVGKTTVASQLAGLAGEAGYKVLTVDLDPQANLRLDFGLGEGDKGESIFEAVSMGRPLNVTAGVRPNVDAVQGGPMIEHLPRLAWDSMDRNPLTAIRDALEPLVENYDLVVIDTPPGDRFLREAALGAARFVVIPTRTDDGSLDGVSRLAQDFARVREVNPDLELLGVALFGVTSSATAMRDEIRREIKTGLGDVAPVFDTTVRYLEVPAVAARRQGLLLHEYVRDVLATAPKWYEAKREGVKAPRVAKSATKLADDYVALTREVLVTMQQRMGVAA